MSSANGVRKVVLAAQPAGEIDEDLPVHSRIAGRRDGLLQSDAAAFTCGDGALVFFLQRSGQNDVRVSRGFGKKEIDATQKLQLLESRPRAVGVRNRDERIEADGQQAANLSGFDGVEDFARSQPRPAEARIPRCARSRR